MILVQFLFFIGVKFLKCGAKILAFECVKFVFRLSTCLLLILILTVEQRSSSRLQKDKRSNVKQDLLHLKQLSDGVIWSGISTAKLNNQPHI